MGSNHKIKLKSVNENNGLIKIPARRIKEDEKVLFYGKSHLTYYHERPAFRSEVVKKDDGFWHSKKMDSDTVIVNIKNVEDELWNTLDENGFELIEPTDKTRVTFDEPIKSKKIEILGATYYPGKEKGQTIVDVDIRFYITFGEYILARKTSIKLDSRKRRRGDECKIKI